MSDIDKFFSQANELLDRLSSLLPDQDNTARIDAAPALQWRSRVNRSWLEAVKQLSNIQLDDLQCIERQKETITRNTQQFIQGLPANNVLLWGPRGTGKSSLIKAVLNEYRNEGLQLIEVECQHMTDLREICNMLHGHKGHFIVFCDDLSFEANDPRYKTLKVILDGSVGTTPENILIYATSNRRHLMPEYMSENEQAKTIGRELHLSETTEEKISLSERFGLWLAFHPFNQDQYLTIVDYWIKKFGVPVQDHKQLHKLALRWALEHGSKSGRTAWQFTRDWTGKSLLEQQR